MTTKNSADIHVSKNTIPHSSSLLVQKVILIVIFCVTIVTVAVSIGVLMCDKEKVTKRQITNLATEYYEKYFYEESVKSMTMPGQDLKAFSKYEDYGFARVALRHLILHNEDQDAEWKKSLKSVCDEDKTYVQFFPESPYGVKDYRVEYHYECDF